MIDVELTNEARADESSLSVCLARGKKTEGQLQKQITYIIGKERAEGCIDTPSPEYISKVLNVPLEEVERVMREMGI